ncbi:unnamed protein product [Gongylonema pulchrum]|uniref:PIPK domain-containing protein n=1 Tax=Gongylonema pulchrum TaxID=637853 RepID=A0A183EK86_9BILA|nr:unnamed protein product [Gongylonema pulchrum]
MFWGFGLQHALQRIFEKRLIIESDEETRTQEEHEKQKIGHRRIDRQGEVHIYCMSGSQSTPSHSYGDFRFQTYAPIAFRTFRDLFLIKTADFLRSICMFPLKELSNAGASGSIFYVSQDDQFIIKTVQSKEAEFLKKLLPGYYMVSFVLL